MTIQELLTKKVLKDSGYKHFSWGKIKDGKIQARDDKTNKVIAEYNLSNAQLTIK